MTREEAIKYLNEFIFFKKISNTTEGEVVECFKLAVEALQEHQHYKDLAESYEKTINKLTKAIAEPQPNEDCISRKAAIDALKQQAENMLCWSGRYTEQRKGILTAINIVSDLLSVTPQPKEEPQQKTGHWIGDKGATVYVNSEGNVTESVNCSECGEWLTGSDEYICGARYCPSCGIKMEEEKNEHKTESEEI